MIRAAVGLAALLTACDAVQAPSPVFLSTIEIETVPIRISIPRSVALGRDAIVTMETWHLPGCEEVAYSAVEVEAGRRVIRPYDRRLPGQNCADRAVAGDHVAQLHFEEAGTYEVAIRAWSRVANDTVTLSYTLSVVP